MAIALTSPKLSRGIPPYYIMYYQLDLATEDAFMDFTCSWYNREGELCRKCKVGYGPAVYAFSLMCAECHYSPAIGWMLYFLCVLFLITVFYVFIIVFNIRATAPPFSAFILMSQTFCMMELMYDCTT